MEEVFSAEAVMLVALLLLAAGGTVLAAGRLRMPTAVGLVLAGLVLGALARIESLDWLAEFELTPGVILFVFLPTLLFESAFNIDARRLGENLLPVFILAVPVLLVSVVIVGLIVGVGVGIPIGIALIFGALISATDPVAVLSIFREVGAPKRLALLVDGESLFNDGTAFVVFAILVGIAAAGEVTGGAILDGLVRFLVVVSGGLALGAGAGYLMARLVGLIHNDRLVEPTMTLSLAYIVFVVADHYLGVSGVMATVAAGLVMGNYGRSKISPPALEHVEGTLEFLAHLANSLIFVLVGLSVNLESLAGALGPVAVAIGAILVGRGVPMLLAMPLVNQFIRHPVSWRYQAVMYWGGLRGAMALAMVLSLEHGFEHRELLLNITFGAVVFTLFAQGLSIRPLVNKLGLQKYTLGEEFERKSGVLLARRTVEEKIEALRSRDPELSEMVGAMLAEDSAESSGESRSDGQGGGMEMEIVLRHSLASEMQTYWRLYADGDSSEHVMKLLIHGAQTHLDEVKVTGSMSELLLHHERHWLSDLLMPLTERIGPLGKLVDRIDATKISESFESDRGEMIAIAEVLEELEAMEATGAASEPVLATATDMYEGRLAAVRERVRLTGERFPEFVNFSRQQAARRHLLVTREESHKHLYEMGVLSEKVFQQLGDEVVDELRSLRQIPAGTKVRPNIAEFLRKLPLFADLTAEALEPLVGRMRTETYRPGSVIIDPETDPAEIHLVEAGEVTLRIEESDGEWQEMELEPGSFFGSLHPITLVPTRVEARARTACVLLTLPGRAVSHLRAQQAELIGRVLDAYKGEIVVGLLRSVPFFSMLDDTEIAQLSRRFAWQRYPAGKVVFLQGDYGNEFHVIRRGQARVTVATQGTKRRDRVLEEGSFFGELALMGDSVRHASVRADTDMETLTIKEDTFNELLGSLPGMATRIAEAQTHYVERESGGSRKESGAD